MRESAGVIKATIVSIDPGARMVATLCLVPLLLTACGDPSRATLGDSADRPIVFAAASLSTVLPEIEPGANYSFDGSAGLVDQLLGGAPADVFAAADRQSMDRAVQGGLIDGEPKIFATNHLVLVVPAGNPAGVTGFDASLDGVKLVVCAKEVPCGAAIQGLALENNRTLNPVSEETNVTDVLGKVASGEADAGLVYATDAAGTDAVEAMEVPGAAEDPNTYWVGVVKDGRNPEAARAFADHLAGEWGAELQAFGFGPPT